MTTACAVDLIPCPRCHTTETIQAEALSARTVHFCFRCRRWFDRELPRDDVDAEDWDE